ncbi:hypothetical protein AJ80_04056 [Polytolypa hystricis UAMH7299]|uniref:DNA replication regulator SLD2 n=1 Tax=Polytolypa hystricis (strain UAMH7299) TaxID=1447883 RepID=A0A2B7YE40_POLH7|nr:hypothetical protein AJ80_04056 [Polytolypa hystricis UAMH7299]
MSVHDQQATSLRAELKDWERAFSAANGGRKAGRDDIKGDPVIAAKYKAYTRLREQISSSTSLEDNNSSNSKKRKSYAEQDAHYHSTASTPHKATKHTSTSTSTSTSFITPRKPLHHGRQHHPSQLDPYDSPSTLRRLFSPSTHIHTGQSSSPLPLRDVIGPTPQRDGKALGLFGLLSTPGRGSSNNIHAVQSNVIGPTPRRDGKALGLFDLHSAPGSSGRGGGGGDVTSTPSAKRKRDVGGVDVQTPSRRAQQQQQRQQAGDATPKSGGRRRYSLTPASSAKKFYLANFFATPTTVRFRGGFPSGDGDGDGDGNGGAGNNDASQEGGEGGGVESSGTPSFLRRRNVLAFDPSKRGSGEDLSPVAVRMPQRVVGKGLSQIVKGLRDMEEEKLDEEMEILRELEAEEFQQQQQRANHEGDDASTHVQVEDSQLPATNNIQQQGEEGEGGAKNVPPQRVWRKKGQKRTTRRVIMRPVRSKQKPNPQWTTADNDTNGESDDELAVSGPIQASEDNVISAAAADYDDDAGAAHLDLDLDLESDAEYVDDDNDDDDDGTASTATKKNQKPPLAVVANPKSTEKKGSAETKQTTTKTGAPKKIKPEAHANYRRLKIRGRGAKGRGGGRFGRRGR